MPNAMMFIIYKLAKDVLVQDFLLASEKLFFVQAKRLYIVKSP